MNRCALCINKEDQNKTTTLIRRRLVGILLLPIVIKERITGIDSINATLLRVLDKGDIFPETAVQHYHARSLKEDSFVAVTVVIGVLVLFCIRELIRSTSPPNTGKHCVLQKETALALIIQDLAVAEVTQDTLVLLSIEVAVQN